MEEAVRAGLAGGEKGVPRGVARCRCQVEWPAGVVSGEEFLPGRVGLKALFPPPGRVLLWSKLPQGTPLPPAFGVELSGGSGCQPSS